MYPLFALDLGGALVGGVIGGLMAALVVGIERGIQALWRWLRQPQRGEPLIPGDQRAPEEPV